MRKFPRHPQAGTLDEEDVLLRPEHDPRSHVNMLAQASPIFWAPSLAVYADGNGFVLVIKKQID
ncbi:hypothetical protein FEZ63_22040 [Microvirga brassicacearum]|uniref:Uncharacterized protein n=1 Tax=Microvirga brassicacearum TaxID=2580413 RepID=A0A5N3P4T2_9HYPH|nr:hypothetical protein FEZ63_22040 [Microvirga brassicacearum]